MKSITVLQTQKQVLKEYLNVKLSQEDWHGVRDVCVDLELLELEIELLKESLGA